jgi:hypothetical protein
MSFFCITNKITELGKKSSWSEASPTPKFWKKSIKIIAILDLKIKYVSESIANSANGSLTQSETFCLTSKPFLWGWKKISNPLQGWFEAFAKKVVEQVVLLTGWGRLLPITKAVKKGPKDHVPTLGWWSKCYTATTEDEFQPGRR